MQDKPGARVTGANQGRVFKSQRTSSVADLLTRNADPAHPGRSLFGPAYLASKTALNAMTLAMAIELELNGIKVKTPSRPDLSGPGSTIMRARELPAELLASRCGWL